LLDLARTPVAEWPWAAGAARGGAATRRGRRCRRIERTLAVVSREASANSGTLEGEDHMSVTVYTNIG
jgi:hypothetical protein